LTSPVVTANSLGLASSLLNIFILNKNKIIGEEMKCGVV
jgi:hypothetical protein